MFDPVTNQQATCGVFRNDSPVQVQTEYDDITSRCLSTIFALGAIFCAGSALLIPGAEPLIVPAMAFALLAIAASDSSRGGGVHFFYRPIAWIQPRQWYNNTAYYMPSFRGAPVGHRDSGRSWFSGRSSGLSTSTRQPVSGSGWGGSSRPAQTGGGGGWGFSTSGRPPAGGGQGLNRRQ